MINELAETLEDSSSRDFTYNPKLDGLRGLAVLVVMIYHVGIFLPNGFILISGGFLGVDIFFVLSGFLITSVLLREQFRTGSTNLWNFYRRRIYRLVPAYWLFLIVLVLFGWLILPAAQVSLLYRDNKFLYAATYLTNWNSAYGESGGHLNHTWSLAIEEQFYIIWPLFLIGVLSQKWLRSTAIVSTMAIIVAIIIIRFLRVEAGTPTHVLYYSTETRIDSLLIGCVAGFLFMWRLISQRCFETIFFSILAGLATVTSILIIVSVNEQTLDLYRIYLPLFTISTAVVILWISTNSTGSVNWFLGNKNLQWIGKISYGLYLWHYLSFELSREVFGTVSAQIVFGVILAFTIAATSYYLLEVRFLKLKEQFELY